MVSSLFVSPLITVEVFIKIVKPIKIYLMNVIQRAKSPTPPFFKKLRNIGLLLAAISGAVLTAPVSLPSIVATVATYIGLAGGVMTTVSQLTLPVDPSVKKK
jgi:hypothetical protein